MEITTIGYIVGCLFVAGAIIALCVAVFSGKHETAKDDAKKYALFGVLLAIALAVFGAVKSGHWAKLLS